MALADSRWQRSTMLCAMYFAQGLPWGFMVTALISYLASRGVTDAQAGELTAVILVPWTFKFVWAPLIDTLTIRSMGRRRAWIIGAELMMAASLIGMLGMGDLTLNLPLLGWMFFLHNCFASLQDVATDALAVDVLPAGEQGKLNGLMWGSKLVGKAIGGAGLAVVLARWGLEAAVGIQVVVLLLILLFPVCFLERAGEKRFPWSRGRAMGAGFVGSVRSPARVFKDLFKAFSLLPLAAFFFFGVLSVVGWGIVEVITKTLYTQQLNWDFVEVSTVSSFAVVAELGGAVLGGFLADRFGRRKIMVAGFGLYGALHIAFACGSQLWDERWFTSGYLLLNPGALAMGAVGFLSMSMKISWTRAAATVFTLFMTLSNVGHVAGNKVVGTLREGYALSYEQTFWVAGIATLAPLFLLVFVDPARVDAARAADEAAPVD